MRQIGIRVTDELWQKLAIASVKELRHQKDLIIDAIEEYLKNKGHNERRK